jgi:ribonuclease BN (tRNA processing enzyme)
VAALAIEAEVKRLVLFHHDPWRKDKEVEVMVERCKEILDKAGAPIPIEGAREGSILKV